MQSRFEAAEQWSFTAFIGREGELATLNSCLEKVVAGNGQFVSMVGEAGVGKSRLLYEFRHGLDRDRINVLQGRCQSYGVFLVEAFAWAESEGVAGLTMDERLAWAPSGSSSSNKIGTRAFRMCHST